MSKYEVTLRDYMGELAMGGYSLQMRSEVLISATKGYARIWELETSGQGFVNRHNFVTANKRRGNKLVGKSNWFKKNKGQSEGQEKRTKPTIQKRGRKIVKSGQVPPKYESKLFCPFTPFSTLKRNLQATEDRINGNRSVCRVKVIERAGPTMGSLLFNKMPWT